MKLIRRLICMGALPFCAFHDRGSRTLSSLAMSFCVFGIFADIQEDTLRRLFAERETVADLKWNGGRACYLPYK